MMIKTLYCFYKKTRGRTVVKLAEEYIYILEKDGMSPSQFVKSDASQHKLEHTITK